MVCCLIVGYRQQARSMVTLLLHEYMLPWAIRYLMSECYPNIIVAS